MNTVLICRDALEDSVLGNLALARAVAAQGEQATVIFTGAALDALADGTFEWSSNFRGRIARQAIIARAEEQDLGLADGDRDPRWSDVRGFVRSLADEPGIRLVACPLWTHFLGIEGEPEYLERITNKQLIELINDADAVVGSY